MRGVVAMVRRPVVRKRLRGLVLVSG